MFTTSVQIKYITNMAIVRAGAKIHGKRHFLIADKKDIIEAVNNSRFTHEEVSNFLATADDIAATWIGRLAHWSVAYNRGQLNTKNAVAVKKPVVAAPEVEVLFTDKISKAIEQELMKGSTIPEVFAAISGIYKHYKGRQIDAAREQVERMLKEKGLTLEDISA